MLGKRSRQQGLFDADHLYRHLVDQESFHAQLARVRARLFRDEDFADLYCAGNGRPSVPPSPVVRGPAAAVP